MLHQLQLLLIYRSVLDYAPEGSQVRDTLLSRLATLEEAAAAVQADLLASLLEVGDNGWGGQRKYLGAWGVCVSGRDRGGWGCAG
jgi:hypothetical protein